MVASNQPFYPIYVWWLVSDTVWPTYLTFLSTPFFLAVPAMARYSGTAARALLPLTGIANTVLCTHLFGADSSVEIFLLPCVVLALLLFRPRERLMAFTIVGLAAVAYFGLPGLYGGPLHRYGAAEYAIFSRLNIMSAAALTAFVTLWFSGVLADAESASTASSTAPAPAGEEPAR